MERMKRYVCFFAQIFIALFFCSPTFAFDQSLPLKPTEPEYVFKEIKLPDDASIRDVRAMLQDKRGFIWMGGKHGLYSFTPELSGIINHHLVTPPYRKGNPAFAQRAYCIEQHPTNKNLLMVGTEFGLVSFDKKKNKLHKTYPNTRATFWRSGSAVNKFIKEGNYLWAMCWISGMPRFDITNEKWENFAYPKPNDRLETTSNVWAIHDFLMKNDDEIWICDLDRGLYLFDKNKHRLTYTIERETNLSGTQQKTLEYLCAGRWCYLACQLRGTLEAKQQS